MALKCVFAVVLLLSLYEHSNASCSIGPTKTEVTAFGTQIKYCEYKGLKLLPGSTVKNKDDCEEAVCSENNLQICGIGINAGPVFTQNGCIVVPDGCQPKQVTTSGCP